MRRTEVIKLLLEERNPEAIVFDGLDEALIGHTLLKQSGCIVAVYSEDKIIETLITTNSWDPDTAREYYYKNIECLNAGEYTPVILSDLASHTA